MGITYSLHAWELFFNILFSTRSFPQTIWLNLEEKLAQLEVCDLREFYFFIRRFLLWFEYWTVHRTAFYEVRLGHYPNTWIEISKSKSSLNWLIIFFHKIYNRKFDNNRGHMFFFYIKYVEESKKKIQKYWPQCRVRTLRCSRFYFFCSNKLRYFACVHKQTISS